MSANVETMFYTSNEQNGRFVPWHGQGTAVAEAPTSLDALHMAGLDWHVETHTMIDAVTGVIIPSASANVRDTDGAILGVVGDRYKIVQNEDAFAFTDALIGDDVHYETAGSLNGGKTVWLLAKLDRTNILGDAVDPYICFKNTHDGSGAVKVAMTPIRVVCNNTLNAAMNSASRSWSMRHTCNIDKKLDEAQHVLGLANEYMVRLADYAEQAVKMKVEDARVKAILNELFDPKDEKKATDLMKKNAQASKEAFYVCYAAPDIAKFQGTAWGVINAMSDLVGHSLPHRDTKNYAENNWGRIMDGAPLFDKTVQLLGVA